LKGKAQARTRIINGTGVSDPLVNFSFFALPTRGAASDTWGGCGASIISPTFAMSSAHCFGGGQAPCSGPQHLAVHVGEMTLGSDWIIRGATGTTKHFRTNATLICHPQFTGKCSEGHDVALLQLAEPVPSWVHPAVLDLDGTFSSDLAGSPVTSIGFGDREDPSDSTQIAGPASTLRKVDLSVLAKDSEDCQREFTTGWGCSDEFSEGAATHLEQQLCAGANTQPERDTCSGDSGSPMLDSMGRQVGIVSYGGGPGGVYSGPGRDCGDPRFPGIYAFVAGLKDFIEEHVTDLPSQPYPRQGVSVLTK